MDFEPVLSDVDTVQKSVDQKEKILKEL
jgi:hypothetical protein